MSEINQIPPNLLARARRLNPYATIPNRPGEGIVMSQYFVGDQEIVYYFATVRSNDGRLYLIYHHLKDPRTNILTDMLLQSPFLNMAWDETGKIIEWAAGQPK